MPGNVWMLYTSKMRTTALLLCCFVGLLCTVPVTPQGSCKANDEYRLRKDLYGDRDDIRRHVLPCNDDADTPVELSVGMTLLKILYFDDDNDVITVSTWHRLSWNDASLRWNPEEYGGVDILRVPSDLIWRPDLKLYNSLILGNGEDDDVLSVISSDGQVFYIPPAINRVPCVRRDDADDDDDEDDDDDDYDGPQWTCSFKFGSWVYDGFKIALKVFNSPEIDMADYTPDKTFEVVKTSAKVNVKMYECCPEPYPDVTFTMTIRPKGD